MIKSSISQFANSIGFNKDEYIPKEGVSISLFKVELLSGLTVSLALVPEAIAFAFVAGVTPLAGLYAAFIVGLITAIIGGRPGMISEQQSASSCYGCASCRSRSAYLFATVV